MATEIPAQRFYSEFLSILQPWESALIKLQSLLVWEKPFHSLIFCILVHGVFLSMALSHQRALFLLAMSLLLVLLFDFWRVWLWPKISRRGISDTKPPSVPSDEQSQTYGKILTADQLARLSARGLEGVCLLVGQLATCRKTRPGLLFVVSVLFWGGMTYVGTRLSGRTLFYICLNLSLIVPLALYHNLPSRIAFALAPLLRRIDTEFESRQLELVADREAEEAAFHPKFMGDPSKWEGVWPGTEADAADGSDHSDTDEIVRGFLPLHKTAPLTTRGVVGNRWTSSGGDTTGTDTDENEELSRDMNSGGDFTCAGRGRLASAPPERAHLSGASAERLSRESSSEDADFVIVDP